MEDGTEGEGGRSRDGPDPSFIKRLEDDSLWSYDEEAERVRRATREGLRPSRTSAAERKHADRKKARQLRRIAVVVLLIVAVLIAITGLEIKGSEFGSGSGGLSTPFSLLPLDSTQTTVTTEAPVTSTTTTGLSTTTSATSTTTPVAAVALR